jgi:Fe-S cluster assembly protein SufD
MTPTSTATSAGFSAEAFAQFMETRSDEPSWLREMRRAAWAEFLQRDLPSRHEEEWMRTDIRLFHLNNYQLPVEAPAGGGAARPLLSEGVDLGGQTIAFNGQGRCAELDPNWASKGVLFGNLADLVPEHAERLRPFLQQIVRPQIDKFSALHAACWASGTLLYVPRGVVIDQPLYAQSTLNGGAVDLAHTLVVLEDGAEATFLNEQGSPSTTDGGLHCGATEVVLQRGARLRLVTLQDWGFNVWHFAHQRAIVGQDASLQWTVGALGSRLAKVNQQVSLEGAGAESQVNGVMFTEGKQHLSYHTLQHHVAAHCRSDFLYKAALQDQSRTVWRGMIKVDAGAQKTDGYQRNDNLLLSNQARADAIPGLEIEADDVRCTHGATTGRVDDELIFYARTRGYTRREAVRLIVTGFFQQVFDRVTIESVREALGAAIARRVREYE